MESLPFADAAFDAVIGVNAFQFAGDPRRALREAARVIRPGGRVVASLFAAPERSQGTVAHEAMSALIRSRTRCATRLGFWEAVSDRDCRTDGKRRVSRLGLRHAAQGGPSPSFHLLAS